MQLLKWWKPFLKWFVDAAIFEAFAAGLFLARQAEDGNQTRQENPT